MKNILIGLGICTLGYFVANKLSLSNTNNDEKHTLIFFKFKNTLTGKSLSPACSICNWPKKKAMSDFMKSTIGGNQYELIILHMVEGNSRKEVISLAKDSPYYSRLPESEREYLDR